MNWTIRIEYIAGEGPRDRMVRINKLVAQEKRDKGAQQITMSRNISEISDALAETGQDQWVSLSDEERGSIARRSPTINLAANTGVKELDNYINKTLPDMKMLETYSSPRQRALSLALPSAVGVPRELRVPNIEAEDRLMAANILGSLPSGGMSLEESARNKLAATVKQALGDLGVGGSEVRSMLRDRLASRPFFNDPALVGNFSNMIKAYHDIREYNLHYAQALVPGLKAVKDPKRLTDALLPTPDSILNGTTAYLIYNYGEAPTITDFKGYVREALMKLLNLGPAPKGLTATTKQLQVGKLLSEFDFDRKEAAKALMKAVDQAMSRGGDFASSYAELEHRPTGTRAEINAALTDLETKFNTALDTYKEAIDFDKSIISYEPAGGAGAGLDANDRTFFNFLVKEQVIFEVSENFFLIPVVLPSFDVDPIGWDRRWMIATMKIIDEYWDMIYNDDRKILLQDLLFLIATRTKELFNYDIDVVQMTILTLLITPESPVARRRARSILPKNAGGEVPLRSLTQLIKSSTKDEEQRGRVIVEDNRLLELENELAVMRVADETEKADLRHIQKGIRRVWADLKSYGRDIQAQHLVGESAKVTDFMRELDGILAALDVPIDTAENGASLAGAQADAIDMMLEDFEPTKPLENWDGRDLVRSKKKLAALILYSKVALESWANADMDELFGYVNDDFGMKIKREENDPADPSKKKDRDPAVLAQEIYDKRKSVRARRRGRSRSKTTGMKEIGFVTAEVVVGTNVFKDVGMGIRDLVGGRSNRLEKMVNDSLKLLVAELYERAESMGADYVGEIAIQPIVYGGATMLTLIAHGVAYDTGGKGVKKNPTGDRYHEWTKIWADEEDAFSEARKIANQIGKTVYVNYFDEGWDGYGDDHGYYGAFYFTTDPVKGMSKSGEHPSRPNYGERPWVFHPQSDAKKNPWGEPKVFNSEDELKYALKKSLQSYLNEAIRQGTPAAEAHRMQPSMGGWYIGANRPPGEQIGPMSVDMMADYVFSFWTNRIERQRPTYPINIDPETIIAMIHGSTYWPLFADWVQHPDRRAQANPVETGRTDSYDTYTLAKSAAVAQANKEGETVYLWREGGKVKVSMFFPGKIDPREVTAIQPNPPSPPSPAEVAMKAMRQAYSILAERSPYKHILDWNEYISVHRNLTSTRPYLMFGSNGFYAASDEDMERSFEGEDERIKDVASYIQEYGEKGEIIVYNMNTNEYFPHPKWTGLSNPPKEERKYKGMIISKVDDGWEVDAYGKVFKTLKEARDFISKKVKGTAAPNQQCVRIIAGTRCVGTIVKLNQGGHYQCKKCKAKYRAV